MKNKIKARKRLTQKTFSIKQMLTNIIEHSNEIFYFHDIHHKLVYVSPQSLQILGYTPDEMMVEWTKLISDNPINKIGYEITEKALSTGQGQRPYLLEFIKKDGRKVLLEIEESPLKDKEEKVIGIMGAARDVSEREKAQESLRELNMRFQTLINAIPDIVFFKDVQGRHMVVNKATEELHGLPQKDIIGRTCEAFLPMDLAEQCIKSDKEVLESRKSFHAEEQAIGKDGNIVILDTFKVPLYDESDKPIGLVGIARDITEHKRAEEKVRESEEKYRRIVETANEGVWVMDQEFRTTFINRKMAEMLGFTPDEMLGRIVYSFVNEEDLPDQADQMKLRQKGIRSNYERRLKRKDGTIVWVLVSATPVMDSEGRFIGAFAMVTDITERKKIEEELKKRENELQIEARNLEEANVALKILLKRRDEDKAELEDKVLLNIKGLVNPYLEKLKMSGLDKSQKVYVTILESSLNQVTSSFLHRLSFSYSNFTPTEIQVANLLKQGKTNKEIGELLNSSSRTIAFHRDNIRKKLGLKNKKTNLKSYLLSLQ